MIPTEERISGIPLLGNIPWGTQFCQFYETDEDLSEILIPYLRAGLESNELCVFLSSGTSETIEAIVGKSVDPAGVFIPAGRLRIIPGSSFLFSELEFESRIISLLADAGSGGFTGLRLCCDIPSGVEEMNALVSGPAETVGRYNALALFLYRREHYDAVRLMEVIRNHRFALLRNAGRWEIIESSEVRMAKDALRRSREKLYSLFNNMSEGFSYHRIVLDRSGEPCDYIFLEVNDAFEKITGLFRKNIIGKKVTDVLPDIERDPARWIERYGGVAMTGNPIHFESRSESLGKWFAVSAFCPHKGFFTVTFSDITERKKAEEELKAAHEELKEHALRLEEANRELESFSYSVSHDLRAPLRAIVCFTRMIFDEYGRAMDGEMLRKFEIVRSNAHKMGQLIEDLLRLSRLSRAELSRSVLDLSLLVRDILDGILLTENGRTVDITIGELPAISGDQGMIRQLLTNLLSNAVKFTRDTPGARIEVGSYLESGERVFFVRDNGVGFNMKYYNKLFGVFQRLVSEVQFEGTGVGLAIVKRIVLRHGGRVWAEGKVGGGATFFFTLMPEEHV